MFISHFCYRPGKIDLPINFPLLLIINMEKLKNQHTIIYFIHNKNTTMFLQSEPVNGSTFNDLMNGISFIKLLNKNHRYTNGLNSYKKIKFYQKYMTHQNIRTKNLKLCSYAIITIPDNAQVSINNINYTSNLANFEIHDINSLDILNDMEYIDSLVKFNHKMIKYVKTQTYISCLAVINEEQEYFKYINENNKFYDQLCLQFVLLYEDALKMIKNQTKEIILYSIEEYPSSIVYINEKFINYDLYLDIVKSNGLTIQYIPPNYYTDELIFSAIINNPKSIKYIDNPTDDVIDLIIYNNPKYIKYIYNLSESQCEKIMDLDNEYAKYINNPPNSIKNRMLNVDPSFAVLFDDPTQDDLIKAIQQNNSIFARIENPSDDICKAFIDIDPFNIEQMTNPSDEVLMYALNKDHELIDFMDVSDELLMKLVQQNPDTIEFIDADRHTFPMCLIAVEHNGALIEFINPVFHVEKIIKCAMKTYPEAIHYFPELPKHIYKNIFDKNPKMLKQLKNIQPMHIIETILVDPINIIYFDLTDKSLMIFSLINPDIMDYIGNKRMLCEDFHQIL